MLKYPNIKTIFRLNYTNDNNIILKPLIHYIVTYPLL